MSEAGEAGNTSKESISENEDAQYQSKKRERKMNEETGEERGGRKEVREKTNAVTSYCNLAKLQLVIILSFYHSCC